MKRFFPTSLAFLLVVGSLGHVFAAAFCPRVLGHGCCLKMASVNPDSTQSHQHMRSMVMDGTANESMPMDGDDMRGMVMDDADPPLSSNIDEAAPFAGSEEWAPANTLEPPVEACTHCMSHSGVANAPISSVNAAKQSNKDFRPAPLSVSRFPARPLMTLQRIGLPREHAPPDTKAPRYVLISVFLI